jgi:hypothetical protein
VQDALGRAESMIAELEAQLDRLRSSSEEERESRAVEVTRLRKQVEVSLVISPTQFQRLTAR